jgi:nicotinate-nucleotide adenylyltransferase
MRLGLLGGTFDPVHYGHLLLAECCREECRLDEVWFVPAAVPPHKKREDLTPGRERIEMLELAVGGHTAFQVSRLEVERGGVSYTVETLQRLRDDDPTRELFFLMGADSLLDLPGWKEPQTICALATLVVVGRPGTEEPDYSGLAGIVSAERISGISRLRVEMPVIGISSREIRQRVAAGLSIRYRTPRAVEKYIETHGLYRPVSLAPGP